MSRAAAHAADRPEGDERLHEIKFDSYRVQRLLWRIALRRGAAQELREIETVAVLRV
jgi:hypothetical protein